MKLISSITLKADNVSECSVMGQVYCHTADIKSFLVKQTAMVSSEERGVRN